MRKQIAVFSILFLIYSVSAIQISELDSFKQDNNIREFQTTQKGDFQVIVNTNYKSSFYNKTSKIGEISADSEIAPSIDLSYYKGNSQWLIGTQYSNPRWIIINEKGKLIEENSVSLAHDRGAFFNNHTIFSSNSYRSVIHDTRTEKQTDINLGKGFQVPILNNDIDNDADTELLLRNAGNHYATSIDVKGETEWRINQNPPHGSKKVGKNKILTWNSNRISFRFGNNGSIIWKRNISGRPNPVDLGDNLTYFSGKRFFSVDKYSGKILDKSTSYKIPVYKTKSFPSDEIITGYQKENISFFNFEGEKLDSFHIPDLQKQLRFTDYDSDDVMELAVVSGRSVKILDISFEEGRAALNRSLDGTVFVGNGGEMLKAVALNQTSFVSDGFSSVKDEVNGTGLKPVSVNVDGPRQVQEINSAFNVSRPKYYVDTRQKAIYVSALAAKDNASLTFEEDEADRDFSNYSVKDLQNIFIEEFEPNHVTVADFDSDKGVLAAYMAVRQGSLPVDFSEDYSYSENGSAGEQNIDNGVILLEDKIDNTFNRIGANQNTIFEGKYISLLEAPRKIKLDPVEPGLISDPEDGDKYYSDLAYGNLDSDDFLEAGVGRYPESVSQASLVFHRSMNRDIGGKALVASEYLHSNWPVILATFGGGMRHAEATKQILEKEGFETIQLIERRSQPVSFLFDLLGVPTQMDIFVNSVHGSQQQIASVLTKGSARAIKNAAYLIRGLKYSQQAMQMYFEFQWSGWNPVNQELDVPDEIDMDEFGDLILSFLPEWKSELTEKSLTNQMKDADILYYQGVGNQKHWVLPNKDNSKIISDRYNGSNSLEPEEIPELNKTIVFDSSDMAGTRNAEMKQEFLEKGASAFIGFSSVNYAAFSSHIDQIFFKKGKTLGNSLKKSVNSLRKGALIYNPASVHMTGAANKMMGSASLYGNPEMPKDPITSDKWNLSKRCHENTCKVYMSLKPDIKVKQTKQGKKLVNFNTSDSLLIPGAPITPLYSGGFRLSQKSNIQKLETKAEYKNLENVYLPRTELLSHSGNYTNISKNFETFPKNLSNTSVEENKLRHVQAAIQKTPDNTKVLQKIQLEFSYTTPVSLEIRKNGQKAVARIESEKDFSGELIYSLDDNKISKKIKVQKGENLFELAELKNGINDIEVYLVDQEIVATSSRKLKLKKKPVVHVFAPDISKGDVRKVRAIVENRNNFSVNEELRLETSENLQLGFLENDLQKLKLGPKSVEELSWRFTGIQEGNGTVIVRNSSKKIEVSAPRFSESVLKTRRFYEKFSSPYRDFKVSRTGSKLVLKLETEKGRLKYVKQPEVEFKSIETENFRVVENQSSNKKVQKVSLSEGLYQKTISDGVVRTSNEGITKSRAEKLLDKINHEIKKVKEIYIEKINSNCCR